MKKYKLENPFEIIDARLTEIQSLLVEIRHKPKMEIKLIEKLENQIASNVFKHSEDINLIAITRSNKKRTNEIIAVFENMEKAKSYLLKIGAKKVEGTLRTFELNGIYYEPNSIDYNRISDIYL